MRPRLNAADELKPTEEIWGWQEQAACKGVDTNVFFLPDGERGNQKELRERIAKNFCRGCPVVVECAEHAITHVEPHGVWGGMTRDERYARMRERSKRKVSA
jgi:WhiB family redox-sensing transcriptional regulator